MPAGISTLMGAPANNNVNYAILQQKNENLESTLPVLHVFDDVKTVTNCTTTANNYRLYDRESYVRREVSRSNDQLITTANLPGKMTRRHVCMSKSHGNLAKINDDSRARDMLANCEAYRATKMSMSSEDFSQALKAKLKRIQDREDELNERNNNCNSQQGSYVIHPKPFITTVRSGEFLMPPPEVAVLLGIAPALAISSSSDADDVDGSQGRSQFRHLVTLYRRPEIRHDKHMARCPVALRATEDFSVGSSNVSTLPTARRNKKDSNK